MSQEDSTDDQTSSTLRKEPLWNAELDALLFEGMKLLPKMGRRVICLESDGQSFGRHGLLGEYIRRRTGTYRSRKHVANRLTYLRVRALEDQRSADLLLFTGHEISRHAWTAIYWSDLLGPDLFPETHAAAVAANDKIKRRRETVLAARKAREAAAGASSTAARSSKVKSSRPKPTSSRFIDSSSAEEDVVGDDGDEPEQLPDSARVEPSQSARSGKRLRPPSSSSAEADAAGRQGGQEYVQKGSMEVGERRARVPPPSKRARRMSNALAESNPALAPAANLFPSPSLASGRVLDVAHPLAAPPPRLDLAFAAESSSRIPSSFATSTAVAHCDLSAFLAGLHPSLVALAPALTAAGFTTVDALAKLVLLEPSTIALVLDWVRRRPGPPVSVIYLRMLERKLEEAGRALRGAAR